MLNEYLAVDFKNQLLDAKKIEIMGQIFKSGPESSAEDVKLKWKF